MPNGGGEPEWLKFTGLIGISHLDRDQWHVQMARHLRLFADQVEAKGLNFPLGRIVNENGEGKLQYEVR